MRLSSVALVLAIVAPVTTIAGSAYAASCTNIGNLNQTLSAGTIAAIGNNSIPNSITLETGDQVTINFTKNSGSGTNAIGIFLSPGSVDNASLGTFANSGSVSFTATASGAYEVHYIIEGDGPLNISYTGSCTPVAVTPTPPTNANLKGDTTDANDRVLDQGRLSNDPNSLPGAAPNNTSQINDMLIELQNIKYDIVGLNQDIDWWTGHEREFKPRNGAEILAEIFFPTNIEAQTRIQNNNDVSRAYLEIDELNKQKIALEQRIRALGGDPAATPAISPASQDDGNSDFDSFQLNEGEELLFFPKSSSASGFVNASAYNAITAATSGIQTQFMSENELISIWARTKFAFLDGTLGRSGLSGNIQVGFVKTLLPGLDLGGFVSGFSGTVSSTTLNSTTNSQGLGGGGYLKYALNDDLMAGLSISAERSSNNITIGPDTGTYLRDLVQLNASLSGNYQVGMINIAPSANINWTYSNRHAYIDSALDAIPASSNSQITASASVVLSRTFTMLEGNLHSITPNIGGTLNINASNLSALNLAGGNTIIESQVTGSASAGLDFSFVGGASLDMNAGIGGIGGTTQSYHGSIGFSMAIN